MHLHENEGQGELILPEEAVLPRRGRGVHRLPGFQAEASCEHPLGLRNYEDHNGENGDPLHLQPVHHAKVQANQRQRAVHGR